MSSTYRVVTPCPDVGADLLVATLIDYQRGEWDLEALQSTLMSKDVKTALSIALSPTLPEDRLIWAFTPSGKFVVKSAYRLALDARTSHGAKESSNATCMKEFWRFIWQLKVPNKIQSFTWRACRNILPTKANLFRQKITPDNICEVRGNFEETTVMCSGTVTVGRKCGRRLVWTRTRSWTNAPSS